MKLCTLLFFLAGCTKSFTIYVDRSFASTVESYNESIGWCPSGGESCTEFTITQVSMEGETPLPPEEGDTGAYPELDYHFRSMYTLTLPDTKSINVMTTATMKDDRGNYDSMECLSETDADSVEILWEITHLTCSTDVP